MIQYNVSSSEIVELLVDDSHKEGYSEKELKDSETKIGIRIPPLARDFLMKYASDMEDRLNMHACNLPYTSYEAIDETIEELTEDGSIDEEPSSVYFKLSKLPKEQWDSITNNYVLIWHENQGCWNAGFLLSDLQEGNLNPPVYMSTEDDDITFIKAFQNIEDFLLMVMIKQAMGYKPDITYDEETEIKEVLGEQGIDFAQLRVKHQWGSGKTFYTGNCIVDHDTLYMYFWREDEGKGDLIIAKRGSRRARF